jgi:hypothetical protein
LMAWLLLSPTRIIHGEWGIILLALYYAYVLGVAYYRLAKTPLRVVIAPSHLSFEFLGGKTVTWAAAAIDQIEKKKCGPFALADEELLVRNADGTSVMVVRPEVKRGEMELLKALQSIGLRVLTTDEPKDR